MRHFPIFLDLTDRRVVFSGAGDSAEPKIRLVLKTGARIEVYGDDSNDQIQDWARKGRISLFERPLSRSDIDGATLLYCASGNGAADAEAAELGKGSKVLVNIVDNLEGSHFITPAIVDRDPVTVAIGTEGAAPVLARRIKSDLEELLPASTGALARLARSFRDRAAMIESPRLRRKFWSRFFASEGPRAWKAGGSAAVERRLKGLLIEMLSERPERGSISFVETWFGDPDYLPVRAKRQIESADIVIHDDGTDPSFIELARREARFISCGLTDLSESRLDGLLANGAQVAVLSSGRVGTRSRMEAFRRYLSHRGGQCEVLAAAAGFCPEGNLTEGAV